MRYPKAKWNPAPSNCYTAKKTKKLAVCNHRMVGWSGYMRKFQHVKDGRLISAHFTVGLDGSVEQHVDTDHVAWTQGIRPNMYWFAKKNWPLFANRNPNYDCIGIEFEDGAKAFNSKRPMPKVQLDAGIELHKWLFENVIEGEPELGVTIISHNMLTTRRSDDPGEWAMNAIANGVVNVQQVTEDLSDDAVKRISALEHAVAKLRNHTHATGRPQV